MQPLFRSQNSAHAYDPLPSAPPMVANGGPPLDAVVVTPPSDDDATALLPSSSAAAKATPEAGPLPPRAVRAARQSRTTLLSRLTLDVTAIAAAARGGKALGDCDNTLAACLLGAALALHVTNTAVMAPRWRTCSGRLSEVNAFVCVTAAATVAAQYAKCNTMGGLFLGASGLQWLASVFWRVGNNIAESNAAR